MIAAHPADTTRKGDLLTPILATLAEAEARLENATGRYQRAELLLATGSHEKALGLTPELLHGPLKEKLLAARIFFAVHAWAALRPLLDELEQGSWQDDVVRSMVYRFLILQDDLQGLEDHLRGHPAERQTPVDLLAKARLQGLLFNHRSARETCAALLDGALTPSDRACVLHQLGVTLYHLRDFDTALERLLQALELTPLEATLLVDLSHALIRLGRTEEAIASARLAVRLAPLHEAAHYLLGNGYAQQNYRELELA